MFFFSICFCAAAPGLLMGLADLSLASCPLSGCSFPSASASLWFGFSYCSGDVLTRYQQHLHHTTVAQSQRANPCLQSSAIEVNVHRRLLNDTVLYCLNSGSSMTYIVLCPATAKPWLWSQAQVFVSCFSPRARLQPFPWQQHARVRLWKKQFC